jgi:hypothetical protein
MCHYSDGDSNRVDVLYGGDVCWFGMFMGCAVVEYDCDGMGDAVDVNASTTP